MEKRNNFDDDRLHIEIAYRGAFYFNVAGNDRLSRQGWQFCSHLHIRAKKNCPFEKRNGDIDPIS
jgi:hypothetical protein